MRLSDVMSAMHLSYYAEVALVLFLAVFATIVVHILRGRSEQWEVARCLPLDDARPLKPRAISSRPGSPER